MRASSSLSVIAFCLLIATPLRASEYDEALSQIGVELAECMEKAGRKRVAAVDFTDLQGNVSALGRLVAEELSTELVRKGVGRGYLMVDRNHLQVILRENQLDTTGLVDPETVRELGRFAGIDTIITGNIFELSESIRITVKAMDTETAAITCASRGDAAKTLELREAAAASPTAAVSGSSRSHQSGAEQDAEDTPVVFQNEQIRTTLESIRKSRDGDRIQIVLTLQNVTENDLHLAADASQPPALLDDLATEWSFVSVSGIDYRNHDNSGSYTSSEKPQSLFRPGAALPISFTFTNSGDGSAGTEFALTSRFLARASKDGRYGDVFLVSVGLTGMRAR